MGDAKAAGIPLLHFNRSNDVARKSSTHVTSKSRGGCFQSLLPDHPNSSSSSSISIAVEDPNLDIENLRSIAQQHARDGNVKELEALLNKHAQLVDKPDMDGLTALHYAAKYGNVEVAELLLNRGATLECCTYKDSYTPFHMVAKYGRVGVQQHSNRESVVSFIDASAHRTQSLPGTERTPTASDPTTALVVLFVKRGADVNVKDRYLMTPLDHATLKDNETAVRALIKNGANPNEMDEKESTPLLKACVCGSYNLVRYLLSAGADCNVADKWHNSVYHMAARHGRNDVLQLLVDHAGKHAVELLWTMNNEGKTPLELAVNGNHASTVNIILSMKPPGSDSAMFQMDKWLLHMAAEKGFLEVVKILIQNGYNVRLRNADKKLPLHAAAMSKRQDVVRYLLELAPDCIDDMDGYGMSAFLYAVSMDALDTVKMLVENNTDILATDFDGRTAVYIGAKYNAINVLMYLLEIYRAREAEEGASYADMVDQEDYNQDTPMHLVCHNGYMEAVTLLHEYGARLDILDEDERISLHRAASEGQLAVVRQLVEWDKRLMVHKDEHGNTPLHLAAENGHEVTVKVLIDAGSDIEVKNSHEETALDCAVREGRLGAVKVLLDHGALIENKEDVSHSTALHVAAKNGYDAIVRLLLSRGATIDRRDEDSHTALDLAVMRGYRGVAQVLVEAEDWQKIMAPKDVLPLGRHSDARRTPMRYLISDFPDVAKIVLSKCVEEDGEKSDPFYRVSYNFSLIDDTYMMPSKDGTVLIGERSPYHGGKLKKGAKTYSENYDVVYENHPLKLMADAEKLSLLSHPLVLGLLKCKWNSLGRYVYYLALMVYVAFLCLLTLFITYTPAPFNVYDETSNEMIDLSALLSDENATCPDTKIIRPSWLVTVKWAVISLGIVQLIKELFQFITRRIRYITFDNAIECFVYSSAIVIVVDLSPCSHQTGLRMNWQWSLAAICAFASWMNLLLLIRKLPKFGIYVVMFFDVLKTFSRFFLIFVLFIVAFSVAFHAILQNRPEFSSVPSSVLKTAVMMIGEFEFTAIFHGDDNSHLERLFGPTIAYPLFLFFCVIMTILLMNLLVGLAVDDIKSVQEKAELKRLSMQVDLVLQVEASMPSYIRKLTHRSEYVILPNEKSFWKRLCSRFGFDSSSEKEVDSENKGEQEFISEFREELCSQNAQLRMLQTNVDNMYERQVRTEAMIREVLKKLEIKFEEIDAKGK